MTIEKLREFIKEAYSDVTFLYKDYYCCINPQGQQRYIMGWGEQGGKYSYVDSLMNAPIFDEKTLCEIYNDIKELEMV